MMSKRKVPEEETKLDPPVAKQLKILDKTTDERTRAAERSTIVDSGEHNFFGVLGLQDINTKKFLGKSTRPRNHVNPLSKTFLEPLTDLPDWKKVYQDAENPLVVDIGCAAGRFSLMYARKHPEWNHLGLEIREPLVERALIWLQELTPKLYNVYYKSCNVTVHLQPLVESYPSKVQMICVQFPDPCFKRKHHRRRVIQKPILDVFAKLLKPGGVLFLQSDVEETCAQMRDRTENCGYFSRREGDVYSARDPGYIKAIDEGKNDEQHFWTKDGKRALKSTATVVASEAKEAEETETKSEGSKKQGGKEKEVDYGDYGDWLQGPNPLGEDCKTEREVQNESLGLPIYRCIYVRNDVPPPNPSPAYYQVKPAGSSNTSSSSSSSAAAASS